MNWLTFKIPDDNEYHQILGIKIFESSVFRIIEYNIEANQAELSCDFG